MLVQGLFGFVFVEGENENLNRKSVEPLSSKDGPWWRLAFEIFSEISTWIVIPIIFAVILGKYLDNRYGTRPLIFISCVILSFIISSYGLVKSMKEYTKKITENEGKKDK
jgi:F0F1-type ATP synthase assembly protein I